MSLMEHKMAIKLKTITVKQLDGDVLIEEKLFRYYRVVGMINTIDFRIGDIFYEKELVRLVKDEFWNVIVK